MRHFGPVARRYSDDRASRYQGGSIGWLVHHSERASALEPEVEAAILALATGDIGPIVRTPKGLYLVRLVDREPAAPRSLEQVAAGIRHRLLNERRREVERALLAEVEASVEVTVNEALLGSLAPPAATDRTSAAPNRRRCRRTEEVRRRP